MNRSKLSGLLLISALCAALVCSCQTKQLYSGPRLPKDEVALLKPSLWSLGPAVSIEEVDGQPLSRYQEKVEMLPGLHTVKMRVSKVSSGPEPSLDVEDSVEVEAKAGHVYRARAAVRGWRVSVWIEEEKSREVAYGWLTDEERSRAETAGVLTSYRHRICGEVTTMGRGIAETVYLRLDAYSPFIHCVHEQEHFHFSEFEWVETGENLWNWRVRRLRELGKEE